MHAPQRRNNQRSAHHHQRATTAAKPRPTPQQGNSAEIISQLCSSTIENILTLSLQSLHATLHRFPPFFWCTSRERASHRLALHHHAQHHSTNECPQPQPKQQPPHRASSWSPTLKFLRNFSVKGIVTKVLTTSRIPQEASRCNADLM